MASNNHDKTVTNSKAKQDDDQARCLEHFTRQVAEMNEKFAVLCDRLVHNAETTADRPEVEQYRNQMTAELNQSVLAHDRRLAQLEALTYGLDIEDIKHLGVDYQSEGEDNRSNSGGGESSSNNGDGGNDGADGSNDGADGGSDGVDGGSDGAESGKDGADSGSDSGECGNGGREGGSTNGDGGSDGSGGGSDSGGGGRDIGGRDVGGGSGEGISGISTIPEDLDAIVRYQRIKGVGTQLGGIAAKLEAAWDRLENNVDTAADRAEAVQYRARMNEELKQSILAHDLRLVELEGLQYDLDMEDLKLFGVVYQGEEEDGRSSGGGDSNGNSGESSSGGGEGSSGNNAPSIVSQDGLSDTTDV